MTTEAPGWIDTSLTNGPSVDAIGTLGPAGTSSEQAALYLWADRGRDTVPDIRLYDTYEQAGEALRERAVSHLVIANAYAGVHSFYMDPKLGFAGAFLFDTPHYGIAVAPGHTIPKRARIATHPAPVALVGEQEFISRTRPIRMLWSVFTLVDPTARSLRRPPLPRPSANTEEGKHHPCS